MPHKKIIEGYEQPIKRTKLYGVSVIKRAKSIIKKGPISRIHFPMLAGKADISEFKLKLGFRKLFQTSPYHYRLNHSLENAKALLNETNDNIDQIDTKVGIDTYDGLSIPFEKAVNIAPTEYRNLQNNFTAGF